MIETRGNEEEEKNKGPKNLLNSANSAGASALRIALVSANVDAHAKRARNSNSLRTSLTPSYALIDIGARVNTSLLCIGDSQIGSPSDSSRLA